MLAISYVMIKMTLIFTDTQPVFNLFTHLGIDDSFDRRRRNLVRRRAPYVCFTVPNFTLIDALQDVRFGPKTVQIVGYSRTQCRPNIANSSPLNTTVHIENPGNIFVNSSQDKLTKCLTFSQPPLTLLVIVYLMQKFAKKI